MDINPHILEGSDVLENEIAFIADNSERNSRITMYTSHKIDRENKIKHWQDTYVEIDKNGNEKKFTNSISLKECNNDYMIKLFDNCGFKIIDIFGDFDRGKVAKKSENVIYIVKSN